MWYLVPLLEKPIPNRLSNTVRADSFDDFFDEGGICRPRGRAPHISEDSEVVLIERSVKEDYRHFVASTNFPEVSAKGFSFVLVPFMVC